MKGRSVEMVRRSATVRMRRVRSGGARFALRVRAQPPMCSPRRSVAEPTALYSDAQGRQLAGHAHAMARADKQLLARLAEPRTRGLRAWEYGMLLGYLQYIGERPERALDVGSGDSAFPRYLVAACCVESVTALDLPEAFEDRGIGAAWRDTERGVSQLAGSMLNIPTGEGAFDLVTCISAIEHLDGHSAAHRRDPVANPKLPYERYLRDTRAALREMARVLAPGGTLYLTTDAYLPDLQKTDAWTKFDTGGIIWSAYQFEDVLPVFVDTLREEGLQVLGAHALDPRLLLQDPARSTFRGRYFTTFSLLAKRP